MGNGRHFKVVPRVIEGSLKEVFEDLGLNILVTLIDDTAGNAEMQA